MNIEIHRAPAEMMWELKRANATLAGNCFDNCIIAVLACHRINGLKFVLGFLTPPGEDVVVHAWLQQDGDNGTIYLDPTLQELSLLWNIRKEEFIYDQRYCYTRDQLIQFFKTKYPFQEFSKMWMSKGPCKKRPLEVRSSWTSSFPSTIGATRCRRR